LQSKTIDPTTGQITSAGSRTSSITTNIQAVPASTSITFYWDGSHGSQVFRIGRDDGSIYGPNPAGSPFAIAGLSPSTTYFFYPYFDESLQAIRFGQVVGVSVGTPAVAFTVQNFLASQQQILRGRLPLMATAGTTGITTPASGTGATVAAGSGGGGGGLVGAQRQVQ
jgi:hypothetical protein